MGFTGGQTHVAWSGSGGIIWNWADYSATVGVEPANLNFGTVYIGQSADQAFLVENPSGGPITVTVQVDAPFSLVDGGSYNVPAGGRQLTTVRFTPTTTGTVSKTVSFSSSLGNLGRSSSGAGAVDATAPDTTILDGPSGSTTTNSAAFTWTGSDNATPVSKLVYAFRLDPIELGFSAFGSAASQTYSSLANGSYTLYVKARDQAGNEDATPASRSFTVNASDTTPPDTSITGGPSGTVAVGTVTLSWTGSDNVTPVGSLLYAFRLDPVEGSFSAFENVTTKAYAGLANGSYTFYVKAKDQAGNETPVPVSRAFTVSVGPDLVATVVSNPPAVAAPGSSFSVTDTVTNQGTVLAAASKTRYYLSTDQGKGGGDTLLTGMRSVASLAPGVSFPGPALTLTIPSTTTLGTYYLLVCADDTGVVTEVDETNNCKASGTQVKVTRPDLVMMLVSNPPLTAAPGTSFSVTDTIKNQGEVASGVSTTRYYLSTDQGKGSGDKLLTGTRSVASLVAGASFPGPALTVTIPSTTSLGTYHLLACADDIGVATESNEANNCLASSGLVRVGP